MKKTMKAALGLAAVIAAPLTASLSADDKPWAEDPKLFEGPYVAAEIGAFDVSSLYYGGAVGYRRVTGDGFVYGAEARLGSAGSTSLFVEESNIDFLASGIGYAGITFGRSLTTLGVGYARVEGERLRTVGLDPDGAPIINSVDREFNGITFRAAQEYALDKNLRLRASVDYTSYESIVNAFSVTAGIGWQF